MLVVVNSDDDDDDDGGSMPLRGHTSDVPAGLPTTQEALVASVSAPKL